MTLKQLRKSWKKQALLSSLSKFDTALHTEQGAVKAGGFPVGLLPFQEVCKRGSVIAA